MSSKYEKNEKELSVWVNYNEERSTEDILNKFAYVLHYFETERKNNKNSHLAEMQFDNDSDTSSINESILVERKSEIISEKFSNKTIDKLASSHPSEKIDLLNHQEKTLNYNSEEKNALLSKKTRREVEEESSLTFNFPEDDEALGPKPILIEFDKLDERRFYAGTGLKRDEAELFSHYVKEGKRIPRRGEVGLSSDEINRYESLGYVMSGTRHKKMNLARMKKEQLLYTAEEKRALAIYNLEEQQRRERNIINEMKFMWQNKKEDPEDDDADNN